MHPGENITSNYARVEKKERANSGPPGGRESPLEKNGRKMKGKSGPPEERRIAHETKKGETEGKFRPLGEPRIPRGGKTSYPAPRRSSTYVPPRKHAQHDDARFQPFARTHQRKKGGMRPQERWRLHPKTKSKTTSTELCAWYSVRLHSSVAKKTIGLNPPPHPRDNECQRTTILPASPHNPERVLFDARSEKEAILFAPKEKENPTLPTFSLC